mgnify:CR=1 FL=1
MRLKYVDTYIEDWFKKFLTTEACIAILQPLKRAL